MYVSEFISLSLGEVTQVVEKCGAWGTTPYCGFYVNSRTAWWAPAADVALGLYPSRESSAFVVLVFLKKKSLSIYMSMSIFSNKNESLYVYYSFCFYHTK